MAGKTSDREIVTTRVLPYPRETVFKAWTDPEMLKQWWGPTGFTNTFEKCDVRSGGEWKFVMHGPDGANYQNECTFEQVVAPEKIVIRHALAPLFVLTATFEDRGSNTFLTFHQLFDRASDCENLRAMCTPANEQNLDKLEMLLAEHAGRSEFSNHVKTHTQP